MTNLLNPDGDFNQHVLVSKMSGAVDTFGGVYTYAASNLYNWHTGKSQNTPASFADRDADTPETAGGDSLERRIGTFIKFADLTGCTWTEGTLTLSKTDAFQYYTWQHLDRIRLTSGTGAVLGSYLITGKTSDSAITISGAGMATNGAADLAVTVASQKELGDAFLAFPGFGEGWLEWNINGIMVGGTNIADTTYTWTEATKTLTKTAEFTSYTWTAGDRMFISGGTGVIPGYYLISSRTSNDAIVLVDTIGSGANAAGDTAGRLQKAEGLIFRLYRCDPSGLNPTNLLVNPTTLTISDVAIATGSTYPFHLNVMVKCIAPEQGTTDNSQYQVFLRLRYGIASSSAATENHVYAHERLASGTVDLQRDSRIYLTFQKAASSSTLDMTMRTLNITHHAPRIYG